MNQMFLELSDQQYTGWLNNYLPKICKIYKVLERLVCYFIWQPKTVLTHKYNSLIVCLHHLLTPPRDTLLVTRLWHANTYPIAFTKTKRLCSCINYALTNCV